MKYRKYWLGLLLFCCIFACLAGCQKLKGILVKPPPQGVESDSYAVRVVGYEQTVTIRATPHELSEFLNDPEKSQNAIITGMGAEDEGEYYKPTEPTRTGTVFPADIKLMGLEIPAQLVCLKVVEDKSIWLLLDNPYLFHGQRWESEAIKEGTRLTVTFDTEVPRKGMLRSLVETLGFMGLFREFFGGIDLMLAKIQANFDPSLDPDSLVAKGLRGEYYENLFQAYESRTWIDAPPEQILDWVMDPDNAETFLGELKVDRKYFEEFHSVPPGQVVYGDAFLDFGILKTDIDLFTVRKENSVRVYFLALGRMGYLEMEALPEAGGSMTTSRLMVESIKSLGQENFDLLIFLTGIPQMLEERLIKIKQAVETIG